VSGKNSENGLPGMASASCMIISINILLAFASSQKVDEVPQVRVSTGAEQAPYALYVPGELTRNVGKRFSKAGLDSRVLTQWRVHS
jgi:hypothetical protein